MPAIVTDSIRRFGSFIIPFQFPNPLLDFECFLARFGPIDRSTARISKTENGVSPCCWHTVSQNKRFSPRFSRCGFFPCAGLSNPRPQRLIVQAQPQPLWRLVLVLALRRTGDLWLAAEFAGVNRGDEVAGSPRASRQTTHRTSPSPLQHLRQDNAATRHSVAGCRGDDQLFCPVLPSISWWELECNQPDVGMWGKGGTGITARAGPGRTSRRLRVVANDGVNSRDNLPRFPNSWALHCRTLDVSPLGT
jgi:hypothetical protein